MKPIRDALDLRKAEKIAANPHHLLWQRGPAPTIFTPKRSEALGIFMEGTQLPIELPRRPEKHAKWPWIQVVPHAFTPKGVVYADLWSTLELHQARVREIPRDRWWRCQGMLLVTGAPLCHYVTVYPESNEQAMKRAKHASWARHGKAWSERRTYFMVHTVRPDAEAHEKLIANAKIIYGMVKGEEENSEERPGAEQVRAEFVPWRRQTAGEGASHRA